MLTHQMLTLQYVECSVFLFNASHNTWLNFGTVFITGAKALIFHSVEREE